MLDKYSEEVNLFLLLETGGRPEGKRVAGALTSPYCSVLTLCLVNTKQSSDWLIISAPSKQVRQLTKDHLRLTMLPNVIKASAEILRRV